MRRFAICALGMIAPLFAGPGVFGQDKPKVAAPKPKAVSPDRVVWGVGITTGRAVEVRVQLGKDGMVLWSTDGKLLVWADGGIQVMVRPDEGALPLIRGELEAIVREMERGLQEGVGGELSDGLKALDALEKTVMKLRRLLPARDELGDESSPVDEASPSTSGEFFPVWSFDGRPLRYRLHSSPGPQGAAERAVLRLRQAGNVKEAARALDEVEQSVITLRVLLWERKASKGD